MLYQFAAQPKTSALSSRYYLVGEAVSFQELNQDILIVDHPADFMPLAFKDCGCVSKQMYMSGMKEIYQNPHAKPASIMKPSPCDHANSSPVGHSNFPRRSSAFSDAAALRPWTRAGLSARFLAARRCRGPISCEGLLQSSVVTVLGEAAVDAQQVRDEGDH